jgi:hypothetical protein
LCRLVSKPNDLADSSMATTASPLLQLIDQFFPDPGVSGVSGSTCSGTSQER